MGKSIKVMVLFGLLGLLLASCSTANGENQENELTVLTVEFYSGAPVPELYITITDTETGEEINSVIGSLEGEATFKGLKKGKEYTLSASSLKNSLLNDGFTTVEQFTFDDKQPYYLMQTYFARDYQQLDVPVVKQQPELPHGCEITSLTAVLNYYGVSVTKTEMADSYLQKKDFRVENNKKIGADPNKAFAGDPSDLKSGTYVFEKPIVEAAKKAIESKNASLRVTDVSGQTKEEIIKLVKEGIPVVIWVTLDLTKPRTNGGWIIDGTNTFHNKYQNLHAVVLTGHVHDSVVVMDPLKGYVTYSDTQFFQSYKELGEHAVIVHK